MRKEDSTAKRIGWGEERRKVKEVFCDVEDKNLRRDKANRL